MEEISQTDRVKHDVLQRVMEERNILRATKRGKDDWDGHIFHSNYLLDRVKKVRTRKKI